MKLCIIIFITLFIFVEFILFIYGKKRQDVVCDYMIVLGAGLYYDRISSALKRRLDAALIYASRYPQVMIVVSGGQGADEACSEASAMKLYLIENGIDARRIIEEDHSVSTYTNFLYTKRILSMKNIKMMVVTCDFHMYRAIRFSKQLGFTSFRWPAKSQGIKCIKYYLREFFCVLKYYLIKK